MAFQPSNTLASRTFVGLIIAQFLAAFNDQAIHASAMFFAINQQTLSRASAISLMPILFYAPWALFCTIAGYLSDRYSKKQSLVFWKLAEVAITLVAMGGFWLGTHGQDIGPWVVLSTVFLMGTHSAFFVPAKYGVMPEILEPHLLSKGNGVLESLSFLAVILGTVTGGVLSYWFRGREEFIGLILVGLAIVGAAASFLIRHMPAADPNRPFPPYIFKPLQNSLSTLWRSRPLRVAVLGIAFFTFIVAFMRSTIYMHGESRIPRWIELKTSIVVGMSALGIGLGSPLAGYLSGGKVELGLVPLGAIGMMITAVIGAIYLDSLPTLITCIIVIGFFTGFYIVPLFTLLQHRAPKTSKGDAVATSNFVNVTGAIVASLLFFTLDHAAHWTGLAPQIDQKRNQLNDDWARGELKRVDFDKHSEPVYFELHSESGAIKRAGAPITAADEDIDISMEEAEPDTSQPIILVGRGLTPALAIRAKGAPITSDAPSEVIVSTYKVRGFMHYSLRRSDMPPVTKFDDESVPRYLFLGTAIMTLVTLLILCRQLPDFLVRSLLWLRTQGRHRLKVIGIHNLPADGPVILATNCERFSDCMQVLAATDRYTRVFLLERPDDDGPQRPFLRFMARSVGLTVLHPGQGDQPAGAAADFLRRGEVVALTVESGFDAAYAAAFYQQAASHGGPMIVPVYCDTAIAAGLHRSRVLFGSPLPASTPVEDVRRAVRALGEWVQGRDRSGKSLSSMAFSETDHITSEAANPGDADG